MLWADDGCPRSPRFGDVYRSRFGAWQQAGTVFLGGCGLPQRWQTRHQHTLLETGFGLGLNFLRTAVGWAADAQRCPQLHYHAIEAYPVPAHDLLRSAQAVAPELPAPTRAALDLWADALARAWATLRPGLNRWIWRLHDLGQPQATPCARPAAALDSARPEADEGAALTLHLSLWLDTVQAALPRLRHAGLRADSVYLDGFGPTVNPDMWSEATLAGVHACCAPGAHLATYTVAAAVRQRLAQLGFEVLRRPGLPPKRHRLQARLGATESAETPSNIEHQNGL
ncbi:MAG: hypothetical protein OHK0048_18700 [Rhodoferax sp.]